MFSSRNNLILLVLSAFLLTFCDMKFSQDTGGEHTHPPLNTGESIVMSSMEKDNGSPVMPTGKAQIKRNKIKPVLADANISYRDLSHAKKDDDIKNNIETLEQLLQQDKVINDYELKFRVHSMLSTQYKRLYTVSDNPQDMSQALKHTDISISILEDKPKYKADLAPLYMTRVDLYMQNGKYDEAFSLLKTLVEEYQGIGYGPYKNWFSSYQMIALRNLAKKDSSKTEKIVEYFSDISQRYDNEVGAAAEISLVRHHFKKGNHDVVETISGSVENRLETLDNPAFRENKWSRVKTHIERTQEKTK